MNDFLIFDQGKKPQPWDICLGLVGERNFLLQITELTLDERFLAPEVSQDYPIPEGIRSWELEQRYHYLPLAYTEDNAEVFLQIMGDENQPYFPLTKDFIVGTALRLIRACPTNFWCYFYTYSFDNVITQISQ